MVLINPTPHPAHITFEEVEPSEKFSKVYNISFSCTYSNIIKVACLYMMN